MSKYTVQLRWPVEQKLAMLGYENLESNWPKVYKYLGLHDYPIFDEVHRQVLNDKFLRRFWFREIGFETYGEFVFMLRRTMHEIMPYYNQLYLSEKMVTDPMTSRNMGYQEEWKRDERTERKNSSASNASSETSTDSRNVFQDTPMNLLDGHSIEDMDYASNVTFDNDSTDAKSASETNGHSEYDGGFVGDKAHQEKGYDKSQSELLLTYRKTFVNIDREVLDELETLFMSLW